MRHPKPVETSDRCAECGASKTHGLVLITFDRARWISRLGAAGLGVAKAGRLVRGRDV